MTSATKRESLQDWNGLTDVACRYFDPRHLILQLEHSPKFSVVLRQLSRKLYCEGRTAIASYAAIPLLVRLAITKKRHFLPISILICQIETARLTSKQNPLVPRWLKPDYTKALELIGIESLLVLSKTTQPNQVRILLCTIALWKGLSVHATALLEYSPEELSDFFLVEDRKTESHNQSRLTSE